MIPRILHIEGVYAYRKPATIDFTTLLGGKLFGIFGGTGSGKSAILESIIYAIYGKSDRLGSKGLSTSMMNLNAEKFRVSFEFLAGNGLEYRSETTASRDKHGAVKTPLHRFAKKEKGEWVAFDDREELIDAVGLSEANFRRVVIVPQGKFREFLDLKPTERSNMLKSIFNLQRFDLADKAKALREKENQKLDLLKGQLLGSGTTTKEEIDIWKKDHEDLKAVVLKNGKQLEDVLKKLAETEALQADFERLNIVSEEHSSLKKAEKDIKTAQAQAEKLVAAKAAFGDVLAQKGSLVAQLALTKEALAKSEAALKILQTSQKELTEKETQLTASLQVLPQKEEQFAQLTTHQKRLSLTAKRSKFFERKQKGKEKVDAGKRKEQEILNLQKVAKAELEELKKQQIPFEKLPDALLSFERQKNVDDQVVKIAKDLKVSDQYFEEARRNQSVVSADFGHKGEESLLEFLEKSIDNRQKQITQAENQLLALNIKLKTAHMAHTLEDGQPCPICGALEHPNPVDSTQANDELEELQKQLSQWKSQLQKATEAKANEVHSAARMDDADIQRKALRSENERLLELQKQGRSEWQKAYPNWEDSDKLEAAKSENERLKLKRIEAEKSLAETEESLEKCRNELALFSETMQSIEKEDENLIGQIAGLGEMSGFLEKFATQESVVVELADLEKWIAATKQTDEQLKTRKQQMALAFAKEETNQKAQLENLTQADKSIKALNQTIALRCVEQGLEDERAAMALLSNKMDTKVALDAAKVWQDRFAKSEHEWQQLSKKLEGKTIDKSSVERQKSAAAQLTKMLELQRKKEGALSQQIKDGMAEIATKKILEKQITAQNIRLENIHEVAGLFKAQGFVNQVASVFLEELCAAANVRFLKLTRQSLALTLGDKNEILVRDFLHQGQTRKVRTLSGGQIFQASLSLALALAERIQAQNSIAENFFFLDEGFGTLDKQALALVFEALKSLRQENRYVGLISHVEELQQEIPIHIKVSNTPEEGSTLKLIA